VCRTSWLLLSIPKLLTFVINFSYMRSRILLIPSKTLLLWLCGLRSRIRHSVLLSYFMWSSNWSQLLRVYVGRLIRTNHSSISIPKLISFAFVRLQHRSIARCCYIVILNRCICWVKVVHIFVILDKGHLGARNQSTRFVARPFGVAQLLFIVDQHLHFEG
jgi:hypothetical protein